MRHQLASTLHHDDRPAAVLGDEASGGGLSLHALEVAGERPLLAALRSAVLVQTVSGTQQLRLTVQAREAVTMRAVLSGAGRRLVGRTDALLEGTRIVKLSLPASGMPAAARLKVVLSDAAGNSRTYTRLVTLRPQTI